MSVVSTTVFFMDALSAPKATRKRRRSFGAVRPSSGSRFLASYSGPDGARHQASHSFSSAEDAARWLSYINELRSTDDWNPDVAAWVPSVKVLREFETMQNDGTAEELKWHMLHAANLERLYWDRKLLGHEVGRRTVVTDIDIWSLGIESSYEELLRSRAERALSQLKSLVDEESGRMQPWQVDGAPTVEREPLTECPSDLKVHLSLRAAWRAPLVDVVDLEVQVTLPPVSAGYDQKTVNMMVRDALGELFEAEYLGADPIEDVLRFQIVDEIVVYTSTAIPDCLTLSGWSIDVTGEPFEACR